MDMAHGLVLPGNSDNTSSNLAFKETV